MADRNDPDLESAVGIMFNSVAAGAGALCKKVEIPRVSFLAFSTDFHWTATHNSTFHLSGPIESPRGKGIKSQTQSIFI